MIATEICVALMESPGDGKARNNSAEEVLGFVSAKNGDAGPVQIFFARLCVEIFYCPVPVPPLQNVIFAGAFVGREQGRYGLLAGLGPDSAKTERENELAFAG